MNSELKAYGQVTFLPFQSEIQSDDYGNQRLIMYSRNTFGQKCIIVISNVRFEIGVNLTKASLVTQQSVSKIRENLQQDIFAIKMQGVKLLQSSMFWKPFHEYTDVEHEYAIVEFSNLYAMSKFISRFNEGESLINTTNSYMCDDEYNTTLIYKLAREGDISLCDFCVAEYLAPIHGKENKYIYHVPDLKHVKQVDNNTIFSERVISNIQQHNKRIMLAFWDIETYTPIKASQQQITQDIELNKNGNIAYTSIPFIISVVFCWSDQTQPFESYGISTHDFIAPTGTNFIQKKVNTEKELIEKFIEILNHRSPDVISGFNDNSFDWVVILRRAKYHGLLSKLYEAVSFERLIGKTYIKDFDIEKFSKVKEIKIKGDEFIKCNTFKFHGTITVDTMCLFRKMYPDDDRYSLDHFLEKLKLPLKDDISEGKGISNYELMEIYRKRSETINDEQDKINMGKAVSYCVNDSIALLNLWITRKVLPENWEVAKMSFADLEHSFYRAGGAKARNITIGFIKKYTNYAASNTRRVSTNKGKYEGAFVFPIDHVLNRTDPLACLDFSSLYPSVIMSYNYSPEKVIKEEFIQMYENDNMSHLQSDISVTQGGMIIKGRSVWHDNDVQKMGVYPRILNILFSRRVEIKDACELAKRNGDIVLTDLTDTQQKALKIIMNTFYGEMGNMLSPFYNPLVAGSVTCKGKELLIHIKDFVVKNNWKVWYGDTDSLYISTNTTQYDQQSKDEKIIRDLWELKINYTIKQAQVLTQLINEELIKFTKTRFLKMAYEKVLFPSVFFSKKRYCGYKHETKSLIQIGQEQLSISGFQIKKKGNAQVLSVIGEELVNNILHPLMDTDVCNMISSILDKHLLNTSDKNIDMFTITETYRSHKNNIKVQSFVRSLSKEYQVNDLAKFDYVFIKQNQFDPIRGTVITDNKSRHMMLKCQYLQLRSLQDSSQNQELPEIDIYQYITGAIKGVLTSFLRLQMDEKSAKDSFKLILSKYKDISSGDILETKKQFRERQKHILQILPSKDILKYTPKNYVAHLIKEHINSSVVGNKQLSYLVPTDLVYSEWFDTAMIIKTIIKKMRSILVESHGSEKTQIKFAKIIQDNYHDTDNEIKCQFLSNELQNSLDQDHTSCVLSLRYLDVEEMNEQI